MNMNPLREGWRLYWTLVECGRGGWGSHEIHIDMYIYIWEHVLSGCMELWAIENNFCMINQLNAH